MRANRKKRRITAIIVAAALFVMGLAIAALGALFMGNDPHFISENDYKSVRHDVTDEFKSVAVTATTADVIFEASEDGSSYVLTYLPEKIGTQVYVEDGVLHVSTKDNRKWYEHISISIGKNSPSIVVYMPKGEYEALDVNVTTGDIIIDDISPALMKVKTTTGDIKITDVPNSEELSAKASTGKVSLSSVHANKIDIETTTGSISLDDVIASSSAHINATTGDVKFTAFDSAEIYIKVTTGDVEGELLSGKLFVTDTTTGNVKVPYSTEGGACNIKTTTGDIEITLTNS